MAISGLEGLSDEDIHLELSKGAKFVRFGYCISIIVMSFRRESEIHFVRHDKSAFVRSLPFTGLSLLLGWWGFPWGLIYTPWVVGVNCMGGRDVTAEVLEAARREG
jgi:hypothetical protein